MEIAVWYFTCPHSLVSLIPSNSLPPSICLHHSATLIWQDDGGQNDEEISGAAETTRNLHCL